MTRINEKFSENLLKIIECKDENLANLYFEEYHPVDFAEEMEDIDEDVQRDFLHLLNSNNIGLLLENAEEDLAQKLFSYLGNEELIEAFSNMENSIVADLLGLLSTYRRKEILRIIKKSDSNILKMILSFDEDSCGGIMSTNFISLRQNLSVREAIEKIKSINPQTEIIDKIYVTDDMHRLLGDVSIRTLLVTDDEILLEEIYEEEKFSVNGYEDSEDAANLFSKYELDYLPVINNNGAILGVITSEDIIPIMEENYKEDFLAVHGVDVDEEFDSNLLESIKSRLPWLIINLFTAFLASSVVKNFESTISQVVVLSAAMPIVTGMGGNSGSQTLSIVLTSIAKGEMNLVDDYKLIFKEIFLGLFHGAVIGLLTGAIFIYWHKNVYLGIILFFSMILNMIIAGTMGFLIPLVLDKLKLDPAAASAIFLTTFTDTCGFFIFLGLSTIFLNYLI